MSKAASAASSLTTNPMLLSGSGSGMMTVVRTQFLPLGDGLSDSDSDSEVTHLQSSLDAVKHLYACCADKAKTHTGSIHSLEFAAAGAAL